MKHFFLTALLCMLILPIAAQDEPGNPSRRGGRGGTRLFQNSYPKLHLMSMGGMSMLMEVASSLMMDGGCGMAKPVPSKASLRSV